jgi:hypothetical protein
LVSSLLALDARGAESTLKVDAALAPLLWRARWRREVGTVFEIGKPTLTAETRRDLPSR